MDQIDDFYGEGITEIPMIDRFKYKGRGRPRKTDYTTLGVIQKKLNEFMNLRLKPKYYV